MAQRSSTFVLTTALLISFFAYNVPPVHAVTCGIGSNVSFSPISGNGCIGFITTAGSGSFTVPSNWSNSNNTVECVGTGGDGRLGTNTGNGGGGGGGGSYAKKSNITISGSVPYVLAVNSGAADTYFNGSASSTASLNCRSGTNGTAASGGTGGSAAFSTGDTVFQGGNGSNPVSKVGGGGGGAAGKNGTGNSSSNSSTGGSGDAGNGGAGGAQDTVGSPGLEWNGTVGSGGGGGGGSGGGGGGDGSDGQTGGSYGSGGGGGGGGGGPTGTFGGVGGAGKQGVIVITYYPKPTFFKPTNNLGLIGYWPMNEGTSTQVGDFSGNGNTGTLNSMASPPTATSGWVSGKRGGAIAFDGTNDNVSVGSLSALNGATKATFSFWIYDRAPTASKGIISRWTAGDASFDIYTSDPAQSGANNLTFTPDGTEDIYTTSNNHKANRWEHWVVTYDGTPQDITSVDFYLNGVVQAKALTSTPFGAAIDTSASTVRFGADSDLSSFSGISLDDIRIYNRKLSASEIAALYANGTAGAVRGNASSKTLTNGSSLQNGLVGLWTFDGGDTRWTSATAGVTYDGSGNNNTGTLNSMNQATAPSIGKLGQSLSFDGTASYVSIPSSASLGNAAFTLSAWVNMPSVTAASYQTIFERNRGGTSDSGIWKSANGSFFSCEADNGAGHDFTTTISPNTWYHVTCTHDGSGTTVLYLNGVQDSSFADAVGSTQSGTASIGANPTPGEYFPGRIDEMRVYNRALSAAEVKQLYLLGSVKVKP